MSMDQHELSNALHLVRETFEVLTNKPISEKAIDAWQMVLEPLEFDIVAEILTDWVKTQTFPPKPVEIRNAFFAKKQQISREQQQSHEEYSSGSNFGPPSDPNSPFMQAMRKLLKYSETHSREENTEYAKKLGIWDCKFQNGVALYTPPPGVLDDEELPPPEESFPEEEEDFPF